MTHNKRGDDTLVSPEQSLQVYRAMQAGLSRRQALKMLGVAGIAAAGSGMLPGMSMGWAADADGQGTPKRGGRIRVAAHSSSSAESLDPAKGSTAIDYVRAYTFYSGLTQFNEQLEPQPALAETFESSDNGGHWVFTLRQGVTFHDGKALTPQDVIYSIMRHKDPAVGSKVLSMVDQIDSVTALDDRRVEFNLSAPNIELPAILAVMHLVIVPDGTTDFSKGIGTGPFTCEEFSPGVRSVAVRNENYWREGYPYLDAIETVGISDESARVNALLSGDVHMINNLSGRNADRVKQTEGSRVKATNSGNYTDLVMRVDQQPGSRPEFVEAMKYLFDREQIKRVALRGYGQIANDQPIAPSSPYYFDGLPQREYDPERAAALLKKAGVAGARVPVVVSPAANYSEEMGQLLQQSAAQAGLNINLNRVPGDGYWSNHWMKHPLGFGNVNPRPTANILLSQFFASSAPWNESGWKNEQFDQLLVASRSEADDAARRQMYADMQTLIHNESGIGIPVFLSDVEGYDARIGGMDRTVPLGSFMGYMFAEYIWWNA
ncbi:ABC transporter substrate-binding protein [Kushneria indalinina]|uniref:Peptide/nickel transport system substrate-binding protein n=1 Tax=Kushneria indalinina DSM 14324 TaxID=1122140 RepID=A0A3D9DTS4_9GAMM|nr:ABC transporter substrate-binding protein [Kushneria indalinina]REC93814.1 peptide/nickel transport system substrate-binding protein [Kushneria indalinina DSM 14324]